MIRDFKHLKDSGLGLLRMLFRALVARPRRKRSYRPPSPVFRQTTAVTKTAVVETQGTVTIAVAAASGTSLSGKCWVIDGDTIDIGGTRIRLAGIDAPEMDHPYGKSARSALIRMCKGQHIRAEFHGAISHERNMATCYLPDGRDLSAEMVRLGMAIDWPKYSGGKYRTYKVDGIRKKLWRCDARQKGRMPPLKPGQD